MRCYLAFALNLAALTLNIGLAVHQPPPSVLQVLGAALSLICLRMMAPVIVRQLRGDE